MKIYVVVTILGKIGMSVGPVPYGMDECHSRIVERIAELDAKFETDHLATDPRMQVDGRQLQRSDIAVSCVESDARPVLGEKFP